MRFLHGIYLAHPCKMLRQTCGYTLKLKPLELHSVSPMEKMPVKHTDDILAGPLLHTQVLGHQLLGLGQDFLAALTWLTSIPASSNLPEQIRMNAILSLWGLVWLA